ncbi:MAG TPA: hypothetical protein PKU78_05205 [Candidatus Dojkabacteria bacterium]|nr:hypothetical protein [Candidatus Dojkabacteria bacterium]HRO65593.1 hypothetical protein [Candidatus Dojkabacteria bacterium]HRP36906.1 hypothetical protein [Candidatus Dojkabacteria bacterium]HRP51741.1 hypothetical protein [Candidatus Dojkabacteria bacterium]
MKVTNLPITPIVAIIISKLLGIIFASIVFGISFEFNGILSLFGLGNLDNQTDMILLSSYSDLFMFTIISLILVISLMMHSKNEKKQISKEDLDKYLTSNQKNTILVANKLYGSALYWLISIWLTNLYVLFNTLTGKTYLWIYLLVLMLTVSLTLYFYYDLKREIHLAKTKVFNNDL